MKRFLWVVFIITVSCARTPQFPYIEDGKVFLDKQRVIAFSIEQTKRKIEGWGQVKHIEDAFIFRELERIIIQKRDMLSEILGVSFEIYDFNGEVINKTKEYWDEFDTFFSERDGLIFLFKHYGFSDGSYITILDKDGNEKRTIPLDPFSYKAGCSPDGELIWVISHATDDSRSESDSVEQGKYRNRLRVFTEMGEELSSTVFETANTFILQYKGVPYSFQIPAPGPIN